MPEKVKLRYPWCHGAAGFVAPTFPGDLLPGPQETYEPAPRLACNAGQPDAATPAQ